MEKETHRDQSSDRSRKGGKIHVCQKSEKRREKDTFSQEKETEKYKKNRENEKVRKRGKKRERERQRETQRNRRVTTQKSSTYSVDTKDTC